MTVKKGRRRHKPGTIDPHGVVRPAIIPKFIETVKIKLTCKTSISHLKDNDYRIHRFVARRQMEYSYCSALHLLWPNCTTFAKVLMFPNLAGLRDSLISLETLYGHPRCHDEASVDTLTSVAERNFKPRQIKDDGLYLDFKQEVPFSKNNYLHTSLTIEVEKRTYLLLCYMMSPSVIGLPESIVNGIDIYSQMTETQERKLKKHLKESKLSLEFFVRTTFFCREVMLCDQTFREEYDKFALAINEESLLAPICSSGITVKWLYDICKKYVRTHKRTKIEETCMSRMELIPAELDLRIVWNRIVTSQNVAIFMEFEDIHQNLEYWKGKLLYNRRLEQDDGGMILRLE